MIYCLNVVVAYFNIQICETSETYCSSREVYILFDHRDNIYSSTSFIHPNLCGFDIK